MEVYRKVFTISEKDVTQLADNETVNANSYKDYDLEVPLGKTGIAITLKATYESSATQGAKIELYYSQDGLNWDTDTDTTYDMPFSAGETKQKTFVTQAVTPYIRIRVKNLDSSKAMTISLWVTSI